MAKSTTRKTTTKKTDNDQAKRTEEKLKAAEEIAGQEDSAPETSEDAPDLADLNPEDPAPDAAGLNVASVRGDAIEPTHDTTTVRVNATRADGKTELTDDEEMRRTAVDVTPPDAAGELSDKRTRDADPAGVKTEKFSEPPALDPNRTTPHLEGNSPEVMHPNPDAQPADSRGEPVKTPKTVVFESRESEPSSFDVMGITPQRRFSDGRLEWHVPKEDAERFEQNHFIATGRVVRARK